MTTAICLFILLSSLRTPECEAWLDVSILEKHSEAREAFGSKRSIRKQEKHSEARDGWLLEYFAAGAWYIFVRIGFCCVFDRSTKELHHGEEGKEKESQEEEVILTLGVAT
jgi:hypothetical protein